MPCPFLACGTFLRDAGHHAQRRNFTNSVTVTLSDATTGVTIYYTLDGSTPTTNSLVYTAPFTLTNTASLHVMAVMTGAVNSTIVSAGFVNSASIGSGTGLSGGLLQQPAWDLQRPAHAHPHGRHH